jgi:GntR family transcriptional regulator / MocR family aminotransferase
MLKHTLLADYIQQKLPEQPSGALYQRLFQCLVDAIRLGVVALNSKLPASRDLAIELQLSRNTVLNAYQQLEAQGYIQGYTGRGTWVSQHIPDDYLNAKSTLHLKSGLNIQSQHGLSQRGQTFIQNVNHRPIQWGAFVPGVPDVTEFPHTLFNKIQGRISQTPDTASLVYNHNGGNEDLKKSLCEYLRLARSVRCEPDQIIITDGTHQSVDLLSRAMCDVGDDVWIEDPGYWVIRNILNMNGLNVHAQPIDEQGLKFKMDAPIPKLIFLTPSHQYPLGSHLSLSRRLELLELARQQQCFIVEDDYDSEFRFTGQPFPSLQGLEENTPVIYLGTFSKTIYPGLRVSYMILPKHLAPHLKLMLDELHRSGHQLTQRALAKFIDAGHYVAHIRRMRVLYSKRRQYLISLIERYLGEDMIHPFSLDAGLHLVLRLSFDIDDQKIAEQAYQKGIKVKALSQYYSPNHPQPERGLLLGFASVSEQDMLAAFYILQQCLA